MQKMVCCESLLQPGIKVDENRKKNSRQLPSKFYKTVLTFLRMLQYPRSKCVNSAKNKEIQSSIFIFLYLIFSGWLYNGRCWYILILFPNFLTGSNEMDTETSELRSLLLLVTTYFTFHLQIKIQLKADICCPSSPESWSLSKAWSTASTHLYH